MIATIRQFFKQRVTDAPDPEQALRIAAAALLIEIARADFEEDPEERATIERLVGKTFELSAEQTGELVRLADEEAKRSVSLHAFTGLVNEHFDPARKANLIEQLWRVAYADGRLDKYEEHLLRRIADLLYVPHRDFIRAKHRVMGD